MEPENNPDVIVREFERSDIKEPLLLVGGANYKSAYLEQMQRTRDERVRFLGPVYEPGHLSALHLGAKAYIHGHEVGGTNPSLVNAMGCGNVVLAHDVRFNREVLAGTGLLWTKDEGSLLEQLEHADEHGDALRAKAEADCRQRIAAFYSWDKAARDHERYFRYVAGEVPDYSDSF
jgi:rhamnosyltransferase